MKQLFAVAMLTLFVSACSWVEVSEEGAKVNVAKMEEVSSCKKLGHTVSQVKHTTIGSMERDLETVKGELAILAQNQAAKMNGDTIVPRDDYKDGSMTFDIYKCR